MLRSRSSSGGSESAPPRARGRSASGSTWRSSSSGSGRTSITSSRTTTSTAPSTSSSASSAGSWRLPLAWARDPAPYRQAVRERRLALRARHRGREAGPADQQLPPPARRGHVRRAAAARRVTLEELLDDGPRGDRRGQDQVRLPGLTRLTRTGGGRDELGVAAVVAESVVDPEARAEAPFLATAGVEDPDLVRVRVDADVRAVHLADDEHPHDLLCVVAEAVRAALTARERDHLALR